MKIFIINCVILQDLEKGANAMGFHIAMADNFYNVCMECTSLLHALTCRIFLEYSGKIFTDRITSKKK